MSPRTYHVFSERSRRALDEDGATQGFALFMEDRDELVRVPDAAHLFFRTEAEAYAFAEELERPEPDEDPNNTFRDHDGKFAEND